MSKEKFLDRKVVFAGSVVFNEGEPGNKAFLVESGSIEIFKKDASGVPIILGNVSKGGIFGEMALIDNQPRMAGARATTETVLIGISQQAFEDKLSRSDPFVRALLNIFVRNIRNLSTKVAK